MERLTAGDATQPPPGGPSELGEYSFDDLLVVLYRQRRIVVFVAITAAVCSGLISLFLEPQYEAKATFYVPMYVSGSSSVMGTNLQTSLPLDTQKLADANAQILRGKDAILAVQKQFPEVPYNTLRK